MTKRKIEYWVIPPGQDAEFVACMEEVLETYAEAYDPQHPVLCMDEQPVQLLKETRVPIEATKKHGKRVDYEYERNGTASIAAQVRQRAGRDAAPKLEAIPLCQYQVPRPELSRFDQLLSHGDSDDGRQHPPAPA